MATPSTGSNSKDSYMTFAQVVANTPAQKPVSVNPMEALPLRIRIPRPVFKELKKNKSDTTIDSTVGMNSRKTTSDVNPSGTSTVLKGQPSAVCRLPDLLNPSKTAAGRAFQLKSSILELFNPKRVTPGSDTLPKNTSARWTLPPQSDKLADTIQKLKIQETPKPDENLTSCQETTTGNTSVDESPMYLVGKRGSIIRQVEPRNPPIVIECAEEKVDDKVDVDRNLPNVPPEVDEVPSPVVVNRVTDESPADLLWRYENGWSPAESFSDEEKKILMEYINHSIEAGLPFGWDGLTFMQ